MSYNVKDNARFERFAEYLDRSTLIVLGVTVTVLAGFLSQVWGSGGVQFRTELAEILIDFGSLFLLSFSIPVLSEFLAAARIKSQTLSVIIGIISLLFGTFVVLRYFYLFIKLGDVILKFAKLSTPSS